MILIISEELLSKLTQEIFAIPAFIPLTTPFESTVATFVLSLLHLRFKP